MVARASLLVSILGALSACSSSFDGEGCMVIPEGQTTCPAGNKVSPTRLQPRGLCGDDLEIDSVNGDGKLESDFEQSFGTSACCYPVTIIDHNTNQDCAIGRPYYEQGKPLAAPLRASIASGPVLDAPRAAAWAKAGAEEHASVAAFTRLALELMALGAPAELLRDVHRAAVDELRHAETCWAIARHFGGTALRAGPFPFGDSVAVNVTIVELARAAAREGCLAETLGAHLATAAAELAPEPEVKAALEGIAAEECAHAVLSFRIVAWALRVGGRAATEAVRAVFASAWPEPDLDELALRAHVNVSRLRAEYARGVAEVVTPATAALFAA